MSAISAISVLAHSLALYFFPTQPPRFQNDLYFEIRARFPHDGQLTWVNCWQRKLAGGGSEPVAVSSAWATNICWDNDCSPMFSSRLTLTRRFVCLTRLPVRPGTLRLFWLRLFVLAEWGPCERWALSRTIVRISGNISCREYGHPEREEKAAGSRGRQRRPHGTHVWAGRLPQVGKYTNATHWRLCTPWI